MDINFGYWMPLGSGGYVISSLPQRTEWSLDYNAELAQTAENLGFSYGLAPARFIASHGWEYQQESKHVVEFQKNLSGFKEEMPTPVNCGIERRP